MAEYSLFFGPLWRTELIPARNKLKATHRALIWLTTKAVSQRTQQNDAVARIVAHPQERCKQSRKQRVSPLFEAPET